MSDQRITPKAEQDIKNTSPKMGGGWADEDELEDSKEEKQVPPDGIPKTPGATWTMAPTSAEAELKTIKQEQSSAV